MQVLDLIIIGASCYGPIPQNEFLHRLGIRQRIEVGPDNSIEVLIIIA